MKKQALEQFISKYHLGGINEAARWVYDQVDGTLTVKARTPDKTFMAWVTWSDFSGLDEKKFVVPATSKLKRMLRCLSEDISVSFRKAEGEASTVVLSDGKREVICMLSDSEYMPQLNVELEGPVTTLTKTDMANLRKQVQLLSERDDAILLPTQFASPVPLWISGYRLKRILMANADTTQMSCMCMCEAGESGGCLSIKAESQNFVSQYYLVGETEQPEISQPKVPRKVRLEEERQKLKASAQELNKLQTAIKNSQALSVKYGKITLDLSLKAGVILSDIKCLVPFGDWEKWLEANVKGIP